MLTIIEAGQGGAFFGMVITYFLSVYSELASRNAFAQGLHHLTGRTGSAAELLARLADGADLDTVGQHLSSKAEFLRQIHQTHRFYPVLRYFHYREPHYALPRILLIALDTATLVRSGLDRERYARLLRSPALEDLCESAMILLLELAGSAPQRTVLASKAEKLGATTTMPPSPGSPKSVSLCAATARREQRSMSCFAPNGMGSCVN